MTKQDLIDRVAEKTGLSATEASKAVDAFMETVTETLKSGDSVNFTGFGRFSGHAARQVVEPDTGEQLGLDTTVPKFSEQAKTLRDEAKRLEESHRAFEDRIGGHQRTLRAIAKSA